MCITYVAPGVCGSKKIAEIKNILIIIKYN